jgi:site-specific DNA recombinase
LALLSGGTITKWDKPTRLSSPPHRQESNNALTDLASRNRGAVDDATVWSALVERVVISHTMIEVEVAEGRVADDQNRLVIVPWARPSPHRRREIVQGQGEYPFAMRPMEAKARGLLIDALRDGHRWFDELIADPGQAIEAVAMREGKSERWIRRSPSLPFLCPSLVQAGIEGRLPRGFGAKRLTDLPLIWTDQWTALGLKTPIQI